MILLCATCSQLLLGTQFTPPLLHRSNERDARACNLRPKVSGLDQTQRPRETACTDAPSVLVAVGSPLAKRVSVLPNLARDQYDHDDEAYDDDV